MDDQMPQSTYAHPIDSMPILEPVTAPSPKNSYHNKKKIGWIIVGGAVAIIIGIILWILLHHKKVIAIMSPMQTLQALTAASVPITTTPAQRAADLTRLQQKSAHTVVTPARTDTIFNALKK